MKNLKLVLVICMLALSYNANATLVTVSFYNAENSFIANGSFLGNDTNNDGVLVFDELLSWKLNYYGIAMHHTYELNDIGDFNYLNNNWSANALQWNQITKDAYITWNNWLSSLSTSNSDWNFVTNVTSIPSGPVVSSVPVPAAAWLFGSALLGFFGFSRRKEKV